MPRRLLGILILLLVSVCGRSQGEALLLQIGDRRISEAEYEYYSQRAEERPSSDCLAEFIDYKLQAVYAKELRLDTCSDFRIQLAHYQYLFSGRNAPKSWKSAASQKGWMQVTSYTRRLPQHVSPSAMSRERQRMDSLYTSLQKGTCRVDAGTEEQVGEWVPVSLLLNEWQEVLQTLKMDEWSRPFFSPLGVHVVKWTGRKSDDSKIVASSGEESLMWQDIEDELLVSALMASEYGVSDECSEAELERYFNQHRSDYRWELPHFRGAVIQGKDPKEVKKIRKALKKMPYALWKDVIPSLNEQRKGELYVDYGIYQIGSDACVDKLVFGCGDYELKPGMTAVQTVGKKLKKGPEIYRDVENRVKNDCVEMKRQEWLAGLRQKYGIEMDKSVLKTVNNDGSK